jgi:site-specific DNA recombinase
MVNIAVVTQNKGVIPSDIWIKVRETLKKSEHVPPRISTKSWLAHKLICNECKKTMSVHYGSLRKDGTRPLYFRCKKGCSTYLRVDEIEDKIFTTLKDGKLETILNNSNDNTEINIAKNIGKQIKQKEATYNGLIDKSALASNKVAQTMLDKAEIIANEIDELNLEYTKYQIILNNKDKKDELLNNKEIAQKEFIKNFNNMNLDDKQNLINIIFTKLVWNGDNILIY